MAGLGLGALCAAGVLIAPALQAQENGRSIVSVMGRGNSGLRGGLGTFTPAAADPKLAAIIARSGLPDNGFRFTPSESQSNVGRGVSVSVRARSTRIARTDLASAVAAAPAVSVNPIAYNLGVSVGWKRFAIASDVTHVDLVAEPGGRDRTNVGVSYTGKKISTRVQAASDRPLVDTPALIGDKPSYSIDMGGSYSLTRNLDVTAGVRYKSERNRLTNLTEEHRDSQAVYVGTAFRF